MINWLAPLDYLYSWAEGFVILELAHVKEHRAVILMSYAITLVTTSSTIAAVSLVSHHMKLPFYVFLCILVAYMLITYHALKHLYIHKKRSDAIHGLIESQHRLDKKRMFILCYCLMHAYFVLVLVIIPKS
jgi:hypothetical protein